MTQWKEVDDTARDGTLRRVLRDDGTAGRAFFEAPHWWFFGGRAMKQPDAKLCPDSGLMKVTHYEVSE